MLLAFLPPIYFTDLSSVEEIGKAVTDFYRLHKYVVSIFFAESGSSLEGCYCANDSHIKEKRGKSARDR